MTSLGTAPLVLAHDLGIPSVADIKKRLQSNVPATIKPNEARTSQQVTSEENVGIVLINSLDRYKAIDESAHPIATNGELEAIQFPLPICPFISSASPLSHAIFKTPSELTPIM